MRNLVRAVIAVFDVSAECCGAARDDVPERLALLGRHSMPIVLKELLLVLTKDIGDFEPIFDHRRRPSPSDSVISITWSFSNGLTAALSVRFDTCRYRAVVSKSA
jgi:hypothetical protein